MIPILTQLQTEATGAKKCYMKLSPGGSSIFHFILGDVGQIIPILFFLGGGGYNVH